MNENPFDPLTDRQFGGVLAEYATLREEILKRMELRNSIVFGTLTFAGVLLSFGLNTPTLAFIYIVISMFLAAAWVHSDVVISELGCYIREHLESPETGLNWETCRYENRLVEAKTKTFRPNIILSSGGVFLITQAVALIVAFVKYQGFALLEWILGGVAILCMLLTMSLFWFSGRRG
jgi:hypothetical protein